MPSSRRRKATKVKRKAGLRALKSAQRRPKVKQVSRRRTSRVSKAPSRPKIKSRASASKRPIKPAVPRKRPQAKGREMEVRYEMTVEEIQVSPHSESHLQTDFWAPATRKP